jgi:hypothetical protein
MIGSILGPVGRDFRFFGRASKFASNFICTTRGVRAGGESVSNGIIGFGVAQIDPKSVCQYRLPKQPKGGCILANSVNSFVVEFCELEMGATLWRL